MPDLTELRKLMFMICFLFRRCPKEPDRIKSGRLVRNDREHFLPEMNEAHDFLTSRRDR